MVPKKKVEHDPVTVPFGRTTVAASRPAPSDEEKSVEAFAEILRILGRYAIPQDKASPEQVNLLCEKWAKHVLTVGSRPSEVGSLRPNEKKERDWAGVTEFITKLRRSESETVAGSMAALRETISDFVGGLGSIVSEDGRAESQVEAQVTRLRNAAASTDLQMLKQEALSVSGAIASAMEERKRNQQTVMQELSNKIRDLSNELDDARREGAQDALTKVFNRRAFDEYLSKVVALDGLFGKSTCLYMIDIDHFKRINDTLGHPTGDEILKKLAETLMRTFPRKTDFVARYGGEEFAVILRDTNLKETGAVTNRLLSAARGISISRELSWNLTLSAGVSQLKQGETTKDWIARADAALYEAKHGGRDRVVQAE